MRKTTGTVTDYTIVHKEQVMSKHSTELTKRQQAVLDFIRKRVQEAGLPPTVREIGSRFGMSSTGSVRTHLRALERKGYLRRQAVISRGLQLEKLPDPVAQVIRKKKWNTREVPVLGRVAAGPPILAVEDIEEILELDEQILPSRGELFALRISGDSMIDKGINDGDLVFVRPQTSANHGDIVVAVVNDEATVKIYHVEDGKVCLCPANSKLKPIYVDPETEELSIIGKVTGMMRRL